MTDDADVRDAWDAAIDRYRDLAIPVAQFNVGLLEGIRPQWESRVRPDPSMFSVLFTKHGTTGYKPDERIEVLFEAADRVRVSLIRHVPRRGENRIAGPVVVSGDYVRPENAVPVVETFLMQLEGIAQ